MMRTQAHTSKQKKRKKHKMAMRESEGSETERRGEGAYQVGGQAGKHEVEFMYWRECVSLSGSS